MNKLLAISYPGGAGGKWLSSLINKLENNSYLQEHLLEPNFHRHIQSKSVMIGHYDASNKISNIDPEIKILFNGTCPFNVYLNIIYKHYTIEEQFTLDIDQVSETSRLIREAQQKICYNTTNIDLDYNLIFLNKDKFINDLFNILDRHNIKYTKNIDLCIKSINQYKKSCINPVNFFNKRNTVWYCWCLGVLEHHSMIENYNINSKICFNEVDSLLLKHQTFLNDFTLNHMISTV